MLKKSIIGLLLVVFLIAVSGVIYYQFNKSPQIFAPSVVGLYQTSLPPLDKASEVSLSQGALIGVADNYDTYAWLGIPYAEPPTGERRWRAPQVARAWNGVRAANEYGASCVQFWGLLAGEEGKRGDVIGQEDCLTLNIWAPKKARPKRPVMVWIHGGGNDSGTAKTYQAHHLSGRHDVVVVTINYRLGFLGWMTHEAIRKTSVSPEDASGNYGTLDIIQALKWVQNNIAQFNGDPNNVTLFGESAGGRNIYSLMMSPLAKGLFHRAIPQSGTLETTLLSQAEPYPDPAPRRPISGLVNSSSALIELVANEQFDQRDAATLRSDLASLSATQIMDMMRAADPYAMMRLAAKNTGREGSIQIANVVRDGFVIPNESSLALLNSPQRYNDVPLMTGTTRDEHKVFLSWDSDFVDMRFGVLPRAKDQVWYDLVADYVSQMWKAGAVDEPAKRITVAGGAPVYAYRFDWDDLPSNALVDVKGLLGASHGMEISFVFGDFEGGLPYHQAYTKDNAESRKALALAMMDYWANFAHTGAPGKGVSGKQNEWLPWTETGANILLLDAPDNGGARMAEVRTNVADLKARIKTDPIMHKLEDKCRAYANLFLHGYQTDDFWNPREYADLGCQKFPAGEFRER